MKLLETLFEGPKHEPVKPTIGVIHIEGPIMDGDSSPGGLFGGATTGSRTIRNALEDLRDQDLIKGVVVRINSPGGSAIASDVIWQGVRRVAEEKPVWVSVGSMAASGGYYIAVSGDKIYVNDNSIVGSIGVVGGKFAMGGLYDHLKINIVERTRGPRAGLLSAVEPWNKRQKEAVRERMRDVYDRFTSRVTAGREGIDLDKTAEGRLFTGDLAVELKMADKKGTLDDAIADMARVLNLRDYDVMDYPGPKSLDDLLNQMFGGMASAPSLRPERIELLAETLRAAVGEGSWPMVRDVLTGLMLLRDEPVLLIVPRAIVVE
jgi:protease-4